MKSEHGKNGTLGQISPFAFAIAGEQAFDWAYDQIAKLRPGGKNYNRLRALQVAGEALKEQPELYATAPELFRCCQLALERLNCANLTRKASQGEFMTSDIEAAIAKAKP